MAKITDRLALAILACFLSFVLPGCGNGGGKTNPREVSVAAASDLKFALDSSGNCFAQLSNKAPFDIFFSADID